MKKRKEGAPKGVPWKKDDDKWIKKGRKGEKERKREREREKIKEKEDKKWLNTDMEKRCKKKRLVIKKKGVEEETGRREVRKREKWKWR